jgi:hypothetical protein
MSTIFILYQKKNENRYEKQLMDEGRAKRTEIELFPVLRRF